MAVPTDRPLLATGACMAFCRIPTSVLPGDAGGAPGKGAWRGRTRRGDAGPMSLGSEDADQPGWRAVAAW